MTTPYPSKDAILKPDRSAVAVKANHILKSLSRTDSVVVELLSQVRLYVVTHCGTGDATYSVELDDSDFRLVVSGASGPVPALERVSGCNDEISQVLHSILSRSEVVNRTTNAYFRPILAERVAGGYQLRAESEQYFRALKYVYWSNFSRRVDTGTSPSQLSKSPPRFRQCRQQGVTYRVSPKLTMVTCDPTMLVLVLPQLEQVSGQAYPVILAQAFSHDRPGSDFPTFPSATCLTVITCRLDILSEGA
jgi:hypothetical protein